MTENELKFWKWFTRYALLSDKTIFDLDDDTIPDFKPRYNDNNELIGYNLDC